MDSIWKENTYRYFNKLLNPRICAKSHVGWRYDTAKPDSHTDAVYTRMNYIRLNRYKSSWNDLDFPIDDDRAGLLVIYVCKSGASVVVYSKPHALQFL